MKAEEGVGTIVTLPEEVAPVPSAPPDLA